jgi:hypothetical protein
MDSSTIVCFDHGADGLDSGIEAPGNLMVGGFQCARPRRDDIKVGRQPRAIRAKRVKLIGQAKLGAIGLAPPLGRRFQPIKRLHQALGCTFNRASIGHCRPTPLIGPR